MELNKLTAISPIDGRYRNTTDALSDYFSEYALIKYRILVEVEYFIALSRIPLPQLESLNEDNFEQLRDIYRTFTVENAQAVKEIEKITNHDVKAVEYYIKGEMEKLGLNEYKEFVHFGLTSQDINNTATPYSLRDAAHQVYYPLLDEVVTT
jgi:adenylosuccinate lyase